MAVALGIICAVAGLVLGWYIHRRYGARITADQAAVTDTAKKL